MNKLPVDTSRLISSLQVITKVESVVKELAENALDADATCIEVKFENYGLAKIEVRDNGNGIKQDDVEFAAQRHYTSKISCKEDLEALSTYGFRGEALSSLCNVADVFITTRTKNDSFSTKYSFNNNGVITAVKPCHFVQGTTVVANNLFAKMPVRYQYYQTQSKKKQILKSTEDVLMAFGIIHPQKRFSLIHNKSVIWQKPGCKDYLTALESIVGTQITSGIVQVEHSSAEGQLSISALIPTSSEARHYRKSNDRLFIYVNRRPIQDKEIEKIVKKHTYCSNTTNAMKWPVAVLSIELPFANVDSNVESDKSRVMINGKDELLTALDDMLANVYSLLPDETEKENITKQASIANKGNILNGSDKSLPLASGCKHSISMNETQLEDVANPTQAASMSPSGLSTNGKDVPQSVTQPAVNNPSRNSEVSKHGMVTQWSKGHSAVDEQGLTVQPVKILAGDHGLRNVASKSDKHTGKKQPDHSEDLAISDVGMIEVIGDVATPKLATSTSANSQHNNLKQSSLQFSKVMRSPATMLKNNNRSYSNKRLDVKMSKKRTLTSDDIRHAALITEWSIKEKNKEKSERHTPILSEEEEDSVKILKYGEGQVKRLEFNFTSIKNDLRYKKDYEYRDYNSYYVVGALKDIKGGILFDGLNRTLYLANLLRLQEMKLYWSLMSNHSIDKRELKQPIILFTSSLSSHELDGMKLLQKSSPSLVNPDSELVDARIVKNGFRVKIVTDSEGLESLHVTEMSGTVSHYSVDDFRSILHKIGDSKNVGLAESRPFKATQFLQAEAVRMSYSLPIHSSVLEGLEDLENPPSESLLDWKCFHNKAIFHNLHQFLTS